MKMTETRIPRYEDALQLLPEKAKEGSVTAIVALERALRTRERERARRGNRPPHERGRASPGWPGRR
jgi:hypothetical protein